MSKKKLLQAPDALQPQPTEAIPQEEQVLCEIAEPEPLQVDEPHVETPRNPNTLPYIKARLEEAEGLLWRVNLYYFREQPPCQGLAEWKGERESVAHEVRAMFGEQS